MNESEQTNAGPVRKRDETRHEFYSAQSGGAPGVPNGSGPAKPGSGAKFDAWTALQILAHRWDWLVLGAIVLGGGFFYLGWYFIQPKFTATAELLRYETPGASEFFRAQPMTPETFAGLLRSPDLMEQVGATVTPHIPPERLTKMIKIDPLPDNDIVKISLIAQDRQMAVTLLNSYLSACTNFTKEIQRQQAAKVERDYLSNQVSKMQADVDRVQEQFINRGIKPELTNKLSEVSSNLTALGSNLATARPASPITARLQMRLDKTLTEYMDLLTKFTERHPSVMAKKEEADELQQQIASSKTNSFGIFTNLGPMSAAALATVAPAVTSTGPDPEADILHIRYLSLNEGLVNLLTRLREAKLYAEDPPGMCKVFAPAMMATVASNMRWVKISAVSVFGAVLGIGAGLLLVMFVEVTDKRLHTAEDVHRVTKLPVLTSLGDLRDMDQGDRTQWAFKTWTMLQGCLSPTPNHGLICGITSSTGGEGRSTWISLLAEAASQTGFRVLTIATKPSPVHVDAERSNPAEAHYAQAEQTQPAAEQQYQEDQAQPNVHYAYAPPQPGQSPEAAFGDGQAGADMSVQPGAAANGTRSQSVAPNVLTTPSTVAEALTSQPMVHIPLPGWVWNLERRKQWRDALTQWRSIDNLVILVELPPADVAEAVLLGSNLPNVLWLTDCGRSHAGDTRSQLETLRHARCNLVGAVLNRMKSVPIKSYFPRWVGCLALLGLTGASTGLSAESARQRSMEVAIAATGQGAAESAAEGVAARRTGSGSSGPVISASDRVEPAQADTVVVDAEPGIRKGSLSISDPAQRAAWQKKLTLGPADVLNFSLYGAPELTRNEIAISSDGRISYLEAQDVVAAGLTVDELRDHMDKELAKFRRSPRTMITPVRFQSKRYYILGKIMTKGVYVLDRPMTVLEAIARAHGLENALMDRNIIDLADFQHAFLARSGQRYPLNFEKLFQQGDLSQNVAIEPGDYIYLPAINGGEVYVLGEVRLPGAAIYNPSLTVVGAIASRGGYSERAFKARVVVFRGSIDSPEKFIVDTHAILDGKAPDFKLEPKDIVFVNSRPFIRVEELADLAATAFIQSVITAKVGIDVIKPIQ